MRHQPIAAVLALCMFLPAIGLSQPPPQDEVEVIDARPYRSPDEKIPDLSRVSRDLLSQTNRFREHEKRTPVESNAQLEKTAQEFAEYMARTDRFGHTADGRNAGDRAIRHGYEFGLIAENIAYAFNSDGFTNDSIDQKLMEGWKNSSGHRENLLDPDMTEAGMAVARSEKTGYYYAVQLFGRPASRSIQVEIVNRADQTISYKLANESFTLGAGEGRIHEQGRPAELIVELPSKQKPLTKSFKIEGKSRYVVAGDEITVKPVSQ